MLRRYVLKPQPEIQEQTKRNLTDAFWQLYKGKSIEKISIKEVTDKAGYNRSTFYLYYNNIYELREQLEMRILEEFHCKISVLPPDPGMSAAMLEVITSLYQEQGEYIYYLLNTDHEFVKRFRQAIKQEAPRMIGASGDWKGNSLIEFSLSTILGALTYWYENRNEIDLKEFIPLLRSYLYHAAHCQDD